MSSESQNEYLKLMEERIVEAWDNDMEPEELLDLALRSLLLDSTDAVVEGLLCLSVLADREVVPSHFPLELLLTLLSEPHVIRSESARAIGRLGQQKIVNEFTLKPLINLLEDGDEVVREMTAWALGVIAENKVNSKKGLKATSRALQDECMLVRESAAYSLGYMIANGLMTDMVRARLIHALSDPETRVRLQVLRALTMMTFVGMGDKELAKELAKAVSNETDSASLVLGLKCLGELAETGHTIKGGLPLLLKLMDHQDEGARSNALKAAANYAVAERTSKKVLRKAVEMAANGLDAVRAAAMQLMSWSAWNGTFIEEEFPLMEKMMEDQFGDVRYYAVQFVLHMTQQELLTEEVVGPLMKLTNDEDKKVAEIAVKTLDLLATKGIGIESDEKEEDDD